MERSDEDLVLAALDRVAHISNQREKARRLGVSESTVRRWLRSTISVPLRRSTRVPLERFVAQYDARAGVATPGEHGSPAEELLGYLEQRAGLRRVARELTDKDLIAVAYTVARQDGWPVEELRKLDAWRDQILATGQSHA